jgi:hypothetical protein
MTTIKYLRMPPGSEDGGTEWMHSIPDHYIQGQRGFDRRIMEDLAAVGVPCYTLNDLAMRRPRTIPQGIPIFIDWLKNLETRVPGPESEHRHLIRAGLIRNLIDPAARGNQEVIDLFIAQVRHQPPIAPFLRDWSCDGLQILATKKHFAQIVDLLTNLPEKTHELSLVGYLGKVRTPESRELAIRYLDSPAVIGAIKALTQMRATGVRDLIEPFTTDPDRTIRKLSKRALEKLPE